MHHSSWKLEATLWYQLRFVLLISFIKLIIFVTNIRAFWCVSLWFVAWNKTRIYIIIFPVTLENAAWLYYISHSGKLHRLDSTCWGCVRTGSEEVAGRSVQTGWAGYPWTLWARSCLCCWWLSHAKETKGCNLESFGLHFGFGPLYFSACRI